MPLWKSPTYTCLKSFSTYAAGNFYSFNVGDTVPEAVVTGAKNRSMLLSKRYVMGVERDQYRRDRAHKEKLHTPFYPPGAGAGPWTNPDGSTRSAPEEPEAGPMVPEQPVVEPEPVVEPVEGEVSDGDNV